MSEMPQMWVLTDSFNGVERFHISAVDPKLTDNSTRARVALFLALI